MVNSSAAGYQLMLILTQQGRPPGHAAKDYAETEAEMSYASVVFLGHLLTTNAYTIRPTHVPKRFRP